jgi:hypothetical protein
MKVCAGVSLLLLMTPLHWLAAYKLGVLMILQVIEITFYPEDYDF